MDRGASGMPDSPAPSAQPGSGLMIVGLRAVQFGLDLAAVAVLCYAASSLMALLPQAPDGTIANPVHALIMILVILALAVGANYWYWVQWPLAHGGQTFAMALLRLRVVGPQRAPATQSQLALRALMLIADAMFLGLVGLLAMLSGPRRQRLGDMLANTDVIRVPAPPRVTTAPAEAREPDRHIALPPRAQAARAADPSTAVPAQPAPPATR